ncbi:uncharacterized protein LOC131931694 [Physella acuta]|uniref:uncharacterized protein LOC131931694 n=1 Tax=Physella acuta TaxID=109671 RepID=UPI0027DB9F55|nr:uncharacterized protein LOC131931694 [Physella acuta]
MQYKNSGYQNSFIQDHAIQEQLVPEQLHTGTCNTVTAGTRTASYRNMQYRNSGYQNSFIQEHANSVPYCEHGTYGQECDLNCSFKCENQTCDSTTGRCLSCAPGWRGDYCEQDCEKGTYGKECAFYCSVKCENQTCDRITGRCMSCPPGWRGDYCEQVIHAPECIDTIFGPNCKQQCDPNCVPESTEIKRLCDAIYGDSVLRSEILADPNAQDTSVPIANLKVYILGHNKEFFLNQFKSIPTVYDGEKVEKKLRKSTRLVPNEYSYWSMKDQNIDCYRVKTVKTEVFLDYTIRTLEITKDDNPPRRVTHFQYTAWPEDGSDPCMWSLVDFEHKVFINTLETITLVHSGTDTTRSSVFIALHDLIRQAKLNQAVDFVDTVSRLRHDMPNTVQTFEQYMFLHHAAQASVACTGSYTHISAICLKLHLMRNLVDGKNNFENEFNNLFSFETQLTGGVGDVTQDPKSKNRFFIIPDKKYQPLLQVDSPGEEGYINAVTLPSLYTQTKQFLTQLPMPTTVNDFWRLVTQYKVSLIVAFKSYEKDKSLAIYLPEEQGQPLQCGNIAVNVENGAELSGLAYVVTTLMDRLDQENYLTVPVVVGKVKSIRPHAIPTLQQYILVYETMKLYTEAVISTERHRAEYSSTV